MFRRHASRADAFAQLYRTVETESVISRRGSRLIMICDHSSELVRGWNEMQSG